MSITPLTPPAAIAAIILAAGSSSRMAQGQHKLLLPLGNRPVLAHTLEASLQSQVELALVVLGHQSDHVEAALASYIPQKKLIILKNPNYQQGMSTSLRQGLTALMAQRPDIQGAIVLLGDQPFVSATIIDTLIATSMRTTKRIIAPCYHGKRGNPVLFAASLFPELAAVTGDEGGRSVIARHQQELEIVEVGDAIANHDVDTWEAYQQALTAYTEQSMTNQN